MPGHLPTPAATLSGFENWSKSVVRTLASSFNVTSGQHHVGAEGAGRILFEL